MTQRMGLVQGVHLDVYTDYEELVSKIQYYLSHSKERERIAKAGHEFFLENRTWTHTAKDLLDVIRANPDGGEPVEGEKSI